MFLLQPPPSEQHNYHLLPEARPEFHALKSTAIEAENWRHVGDVADGVLAEIAAKMKPEAA